MLIDVNEFEIFISHLLYYSPIKFYKQPKIVKIPDFTSLNKLKKAKKAQKLK